MKQVEEQIEAKRRELGVQSLSYTAWKGVANRSWWAVYDESLDVSVTAPTFGELAAKLVNARNPRVVTLGKIAEHRAEIAKLEAQLESEAGNE